MRLIVLVSEFKLVMERENFFTQSDLLINLLATCLRFACAIRKILTNLAD